MIALLNFCSKDQQQALSLLRWINTLGGTKPHDLILHFSQSVKRAENFQELVIEAEKGFASVSTVVVDGEDERGWPWSPNHAWMNALRIIREKIMKPWLWMEPDCCPTKSTWLDQIEVGYTAAGKPFMGAEVRAPALRMSGIGVYPPMVVSYLVKRHLPDLFVRKEAFDAYFAPEIVPNCHFTKLIQDVLYTSREPDVTPTFPDEASLSMLDPQAVLFHRCKDDSIIRRLTERQGELDSSESHKLASAGSIPAPDTGPTREELMAEIERLKSEKTRVRGKTKHFITLDEIDFQVKPKRTAAEQAVIDARMAKARAGRKKATV